MTAWTIRWYSSNLDRWEEAKKRNTLQLNSFALCLLEKNVLDCGYLRIRENQNFSLPGHFEARWNPTQFGETTESNHKSTRSRDKKEAIVLEPEKWNPKLSKPLSQPPVTWEPRKVRLSTPAFQFEKIWRKVFSWMRMKKIRKIDLAPWSFYISWKVLMTPDPLKLMKEALSHFEHKIGTILVRFPPLENEIVKFLRFLPGMIPFFPFFKEKNHGFYFFPFSGKCFKKEDRNWWIIDSSKTVS